MRYLFAILHGGLLVGLCQAQLTCPPAGGEALEVASKYGASQDDNKTSFCLLSIFGLTLCLLCIQSHRLQRNHLLIFSKLRKILYATSSAWLQRVEAASHLFPQLPIVPNSFLSPLQGLSTRSLGNRSEARIQQESRSGLVTNSNVHLRSPSEGLGILTNMCS